AVIDSYLKRLPKLIGKAESLLVLVVSRGFTHKGHTGFLACSDTVAADPVGTALSVRDLVEALRKAKCPETMVLIDADPLPASADAPDLSPGLVNGELEHYFNIEYAFAGLVSCNPGQRSFDSGQLRRGIWRHHLIEAFTGKTRSGVKKDGTLTIMALH